MKIGSKCLRCNEVTSAFPKLGSPTCGDCLSELHEMHRKAEALKIERPL